MTMTFRLYIQNVVELRDRYGGDAYPRPREDDIDNLVASGLMNVQSQVIQRDSIRLEEISRENVMQGPLVKVCGEFINHKWMVFHNIMYLSLLLLPPPLSLSVTHTHTHS